MRQERLQREREQEAALSDPRPTATVPRVEQLLALQRGAGNAAVARAVLARTFTESSYQEALAKKAEFMQKGLYHRNDFRPSTGMGNFDVVYDPMGARLIVTVRCHFVFLKGRESDWPAAEPEELVWDPAAAAKWKRDFMRVVSDKWSDKFTFHCTRPWWEELQANVKIRFVESAKDPHYDLKVTKIPEVEGRLSRVTSPRWHQDKGKVRLDSEGLSTHDKQSGAQRPAVHEAGHMLGLGDEYPPKKGKNDKSAAHDVLVRTEFGHGVPRRRDGRVMSNGEDIEPEHGVTFMEALRVVTTMREWSFDAKPPMPVPSEPMDQPAPKLKQDPLAPEEPEVAFA